MGFRLDGLNRQTAPGAAHATHGKGLPWADQARGAATALSLLLLAGCVGTPVEAPSDFWRNVTSEGVEGRPLPPGGEGPFVPLGRLPAKPTPPSREARDAVEAALREGRSEAAAPIVSNGTLPPPPMGTPGQGQVPVEPPAAANLRPAPPVSWRPDDLAPQPAPGRPPAAGTAPEPAAPAMPAMPDAPPAAPPTELMAPPPAPIR